VISPFYLEQNLRAGKVDRWKLHATFMRMWARVLEHPRIDEMILLPGAETSLGATMEVGLFVAQGRPISQYRPLGGGRFRTEPYRYDPILSRVEHTLLKPGVTEASIREESRWAGKNLARAMVVRPEFVYAVAQELRGSLTVPVSVIGFPQRTFTSLADFPAVETAAKIADARNAIDGAQAGGAPALELDMIMDLHAFKARDYAKVAADIREVIAAAKSYGEQRGVATRVKVIIETSLLEQREVAIASAIVRHTSALSVKASTGFGPRGARLRDIKTMERVVRGSKLVKVSGGVTAENFAQFAKHGHIFGMSRSRELKSGPPRTARPARTGRTGGY
jgi:deoxyribose-phosphate aldolase